MIRETTLLIAVTCLAAFATEAGVSHLRQRVYYVENGAIIGQTPDQMTADEDTLVSPYAWGMKNMVVHDGTFYHVYSVIDGDHDVYLRTSTDGLNWTGRIRVNDDSLDAAQYSPTVAVHGALVVIAWTDFRTVNPQIRAAWSTDGGVTWGASAPVSDHTDNVNITGHVAVGRDGTFYIVWAREDTDNDWHDVFFSRSTGVSGWTEPAIAYSGTSAFTSYAHLVAGDPGEVIILVREVGYFRANVITLYSSDLGNSWEERAPVTDYTEVGQTIYGTTATVDSSGAVNVAFFFTNTQTHADSARIYFSRSADDGESWTTHRRVNDDRPIHPGAQVGSAYCHPSMAVSPGGTIYVVWSDRRIDPVPGSNDYDVYLSFSTDGGVTWSADVRVNDDSTAPGQWYSSVAVKSDGLTDTVLIVWRDDRDFVTDVADGGPSLPMWVELFQNYPNPFNPATTIAFDLPAGAHVSLEVFDITGQRVSTLVDQKLGTGRHTIRWNGISDAGHEVPTGVYLYRITTADGLTESRRMILLR
jgi:hypothetical protein